MQNYKLKFKTNSGWRGYSGYLMIESLISLTIITVGLLGIFTLLSRSLSLNRVVADRYAAAYLAAEGIEIVKNMIDNRLLGEGPPWNEGLSDGEYEVDYDDIFYGDLAPADSDALNYLKYDPAAGLYSYGGPKPTNFQRIINISNSEDGQEITAQSTVNWVTRGGAQFSITLEDHFFNWR